MPTAELIAIGTELLLGEIQDTNTRYLARTLRDLGVNIYRATIVGDNLQRIAQAIREAMSRSQIVITTGGLGPTVDDPTRAAVALALEVETEFHPELWEQIKSRFQHYGRVPSENNRRQAWIPSGAIPVENPVGTAPSFICETANSCVISLPGVPREMEYLIHNAVIPYLRERFQLIGTIKARVLHVAGVGESTVDDWIGDLMTNENPTVGLLAHPGQVDVRITAKADTVDEANRMIAEMETRVRERIQEGLYGADQQTLEETVVQALRDQNLSAVMVECGLKGALRERVKSVQFPPDNVAVSDDPCSQAELSQKVEMFRVEHNADLAIGVSLLPLAEKHVLYLSISSRGSQEEFTRSFGGERALSNPWSVNNALEMLRRKIQP